MGLVGTLQPKPAPPRGFQSDPEASTPLQALLQIGLGGDRLFSASTGAFWRGRRSQALLAELVAVWWRRCWGGVLLVPASNAQKTWVQELPQLDGDGYGLGAGGHRSCRFCGWLTAALSLAVRSLGLKGPSC